MDNDSEALVMTLATSIARDIMATGDDPDMRANRIQYMGGKWPDEERKLGGLNEMALAGVIHSCLRKRLFPDA